MHTLPTKEYLAEKLHLVYGEEVFVSNIYTCKDSRRRVDYGVVGKVKTHLLARAILEIKLGRPLTSNETVDHLDEDKTNDTAENLQVLSPSDNIKKSRKHRPHPTLGRAQPIHERKRGDKNGMAKLRNDLVASCREQFWAGDVTKKQLMAELGVCYKTVRSMLSGETYIDAGGPTSGPSLH